ncbi:MAG TPA: branched-chain amino acid ABC transporter permease [Thermodesulfobacteriota bacterium]|nr:branched-chain amino acid ABC transporter permease [Thermodesulfobacteriota bacterium]
MLNNRLTYFGLFLLLLIAIVLPFSLTDYWIHSLTITLYYVMMATTWNLLGGYTGQFSLSHHTFAVIGSYTSALLMNEAGVPLWMGMTCSWIFNAFISVLLGILCMRMRGIYLALTTWAFAEIVRTYIRMDFAFTGGDRGLKTALFFKTMNPLPYYYLFLAFAVITIIVIAIIMRSRIGYYLRAIRNDEVAAQAMGVNLVRWKVFVFMVASVFASVAGTLYGHFTGLISPVSGDFYEMALIIIFVVIGGMRSQAGPVVGALSIRYLAEILKKWPEVRMILLSLAVIVIMRLFNGGLMEFLRRGSQWIQRKEKR